MSRIYVASSWRNTYQPRIIALVNQCGHQVYDFRNPPNKAGFHWKDIEEDWESWTPEQYKKLLLTTPDASFGYTADRRAMQWADVGLLVLPSGRSAHLEAGYFHGASKRLIIYMPEKVEPELMYLMADEIAITEQELINFIGRV